MLSLFPRASCFALGLLALGCSALVACSGSSNSNVGDPAPAFGSTTSSSGGSSSSSGGSSSSSGGSSSSSSSSGGSSSSSGGSSSSSGGSSSSSGGVGPETEADQVPCDAALAMASTDPYEAAKALGICKKTTPGATGSGVISARFIRPDGTPSTDAIGWGLLPKLGVNAAVEGGTLFALSTGTARGPLDPGFESPSGKDKGYTHGMPAGFPKSRSRCPGVTPSTSAHDGIALELKVRVPAYANSFSFEHSHFSFEYPSFVCTQYTDHFAALVSPAPAGAADGNVALDANGDTIGVNSTFLDACTAGTYGGLTFACAKGEAPLQGTGFEGHGGTGWLKTVVPATPSTEITITFAIWDAGDGVLDSTVLVDNFRFHAAKATVVSTSVK